MQDAIFTSLQAMLIIAIPVLSGYAIYYLNKLAKRAQEKVANATASRYIEEAADAVTTAVLNTAQTYTDALKKSDTFSLDNQQEALNRAIKVAQNQLSADATRFINEVYGDATKYLAEKIEAEIQISK